jgi:hypothetical protein
MPDLQARLGSGWSQIDDDDMGELDLRTLVEQYTDRRTADQAADGWAGDHYVLLQRDSDGAIVLALRTAWDTQTDAVEFFEAYRRVAAARHGSDLQDVAPADIPLTGPAPDAVWAGRAGEWNHVLVRDGTNVALVVSTDPIGLQVANSLRPQAVAARAPEPTPAASGALHHVLQNLIPLAR